MEMVIQIVLLAIVFFGITVMPIYAMYKLKKDQGKTVDEWNSKNHKAESVLEAQLMQWTKNSLKAAQLSGVLLVCYWAYRIFN